MKTKRQQAKDADKMISVPVVNPNAAGTDIGSKNHYVSVTQDNVKEFPVFTSEYGFEVFLVNARHLKNIKGHKTDVVDSKWLQFLHSVWLLSNNFQPDLLTHELRTYARHRQSLIENASKYINKMNKTLVLTNIQLSAVLRDITITQNIPNIVISAI